MRKPRKSAEPSPTPPEPIRVFVGDLHCEGPTGLSPKPKNDQQYWLLACWAAAVSRVQALAVGKEFGLMLGGDLVDLPGRDARNAAIELLQPLANTASSVWGVPGTEYHVGDDGEEDRSVYDALGARDGRAKQVHRLRIAGRVLHWAHHAHRIGGEPWTEYDGLYRSAKRSHEWARVQDKPVPDLVIGHHVHRSPGEARYRTTRAVVCGCWQLPTPYAAKRVTWSLPTIGLVIWWPARDVIEELTYVIPDELISA